MKFLKELLSIDTSDLIQEGHALSKSDVTIISRLTDAQLNEIYSAYKDGHSATEIAEFLNGLGFDVPELGNLGDYVLAVINKAALEYDTRMININREAAK